MYQQNFKELHILLIEDDPDDYVLVKEMLSEIKDVDVKLTWAQNLNEAIYQCKDKIFDVYLVDYRLGEHTGLDFLTQACPRPIKAPIIILTVTDDLSLDHTAIRLGASDYLVKGELTTSILRRAIFHALDRKQIEMQLQHSHARYQELVEKVNYIIYTLDRFGVVTYINPVVEKITFFTPQEMIGQKFTNFIYPGDVAKYLKIFELSGKNISETIDFRLFTRNKEICWLRGEVTPIMNNGVFEGVRGVLQDITQVKQREEDFTKLYMAIEQTDDIVLISDSTGKIEYVNQSFVKTTGYSFVEVLGKTPQILKSGKHKADFYKNVWETLLQGKPFRGTFINRKKNGEIFYEEKTITPVIDESGNITHFISTGRDITQRKKEEKEKQKVRQELFQAQKMEIIGSLAGGIAHDFNNLLMVIQGNAQLALIKFQQNKELKKLLQPIYQTSRRAAQLTGQLLMLSRKQVAEKQPIQINEVVEGILKMLRRLIRENVEIELQLDESLPYIEADSNNIEQIIMNLVLNAQDAIRGMGKIKIETYQAAAKHIASKAENKRYPSYVYLKVSDTGMGMPKEIRSKIFEPLFTTKPPGKGTGLGLAVVKRIADEHQASIDVKSKPGKGTTFTIGFPPIYIEDAPAKKEEDLVEMVKGNGESILIIEDEDSVRNLLVTTLTENGYQTKSVNSVEEAENILDRGQKKFHLIITDMVLTGKSGLDLVQDLKLKGWDLPIIFSTGYVEQKDDLQALYDSGYPILRKPYNLKELLSTIHNLLSTKMNMAIQ